LELKNLLDFYMEAKDMNDIEQNKFFYDESFKVVTRLTGEFTLQLGVSRQEMEKLRNEIKSLEEKIATLENVNEEYANELYVLRNTVETVNRGSNGYDEDLGYGNISLAAELGYDLSDQVQDGLDLNAGDSKPSVIQLEREDREMDSVYIIQNKESNKDVLRESKVDEANTLKELIGQQVIALKGDNDNLILHHSISMLYDYSSSEEEQEEEILGFSKLVSDKPVIDWNLAEVLEFLKIIEKGRLQKFIPEFKRTLVTGEVLLSLQRTELKHDYNMSREDITGLFKSLFVVDPNFKTRMTKKYKKKRKRQKLANNEQMVMSTVDWDSFISKQKITFDWQIVKCCVGELVRLKDNREGRVLFKGPTEFSDGVWLGIELTKGEGLNDGMVKGVRYFKTHAKKHGVFVREQKVKEKLDMKMYQPFQLNRRASVLDLASPRASSGIVSFGSRSNSTRMLYFGESADFNSLSMVPDDSARIEEKCSVEEDWYLSSSTEGR